MKKIILASFVFVFLFSGNNAMANTPSGTCSTNISASKTQLTSPETVTITYGASSGCNTMRLRYNSDNDNGAITGDMYASPYATYSQLITKTTTFNVTGYDTVGNQSDSAVTITFVAPAPSAPTVSINASPSSIAYGASSNISWNSTNATYCSSSNGQGGTNPSGSFNTGSLTSNQTYSVTCSGNGGSKSASTTVSVGSYVPPAPQNPTVSVSANPSNISYGASSNISWTSNNANYCYSSNGQGGTNVTGYFNTGSLTNTTTYTVTCYNNAGASKSANATVTVNQVTPPPYNPEPTVTLTANPSSVQQGNSSTISWTSTNATSCSGISGSSTSGTFNTGALYSTTTYNIVCTGLGGSKSASVSVGVTSTPNPPSAPTVTVTANPSSVIYGGTSFVTWTSTNATYCYSSNGQGGTNSSGSFSTGSLTSTQTYTVICSGNGGVGQNSATVIVGQAPVSNPTGTLTSSVNTCTIPNGASTCNIFFVWNTMNPAPGAVSAVVSNTGSTVGYGNNNSGNFNIPYGSVTYYLYHNAIELANKTVSGVCLSGSAWSNNACNTVVAPTAPTVIVTASPSNVSYGGSSTISWTSTNATSCSASQPNTSTGTNGNFTVNNLTSSQTYTVTCVNSTSGLSGSNSASVSVTGQPVAPTGTLNPSKPVCTIAVNASSCNIFFVWNTTNPVGVSQVIKYGSNNPVGTGNNNSGDLSVPYEGATFALYNNSNELSTKYVNAVCPTSTTWDGSICKSNTVTPPTTPTVIVTASPSNVSYGGSSVVSWVATNATYCSSSSLSGGNGVTGSFPANNLTSSVTYVVTCTNSNSNPVTGTVSISVTGQPAPTTGTLTSSAESCVIPVGSSSCKINFSWTTTNPVGTSQVMRYGINSPVGYGNNNSGLFSVYFDGDVFALYNNANTLAVKSVDASCASGSTWNGSICASGTTGNNNVCTINNFSANTNQIYQSQAVILSWNTSNCTNVNISGIGSVNLSSSGQTVYPSVSTTYNINATGPNGSDYDSVFVNVGNNNNNNYCTIYSFSSNANSVQAGSPVTLTWNTNNCTNVSIVGIGNVNPSGSMPVYPSGYMNYVMNAYGTNGSDTKSVIVNTNTYVPPQPPSVYNSCAVTTIATGITSNSAQVHGLVSGSNYGTTNTYFEYGPTASLGTRTVSRAVVGNNLFNEFLYNLTPNTLYYFRSVADCQNGTSYGAITNFRTGNVVGIPTGNTTYYNNGNTNTTTTNTIRTGTTVIGTSSPIMLRIENKYEAMGIGDTVDYVVYYKNIGSTLLTRPILQVIAPSGIELTNASRGTYSALTNTLTVQLEDLYPNQEGFVYVQGIVRDVPINNANIVTTALLVYTNPNGAQENAMAYVLNHSREFYNGNALGAAAFFGWFGGIGLIGWLLIIIFILLLILLIRSFFYNRRSVTTINDGHGGTTHTTVTH